MESQKTNWAQFIPLVTVFFFWGFVAASNDILIPVFKKAFDLTQGQSQLVSVAFYIAYTVGSIIYMLISLAIGKDLVNKIGYKNGLALGLTISALGTLLFYPAANLHSFLPPYVTILGLCFRQVQCLHCALCFPEFRSRPLVAKCCRRIPLTAPSLHPPQTTSQSAPALHR